MRDVTAEILELIRQAATDLPAEIESRLKAACKIEAPGSAARQALETVLQNVSLARRKSMPICQDTGTPSFFVAYSNRWQPQELKNMIRAAVAEATRRAYLRPNAVDTLTGKNSGDNLGDAYLPAMHFEPVEGGVLIVDLLLKGGGCENVSSQYSLPDEKISAGRDLDGVRRAALDAVWRAQGEGCAPGFLSLVMGGDRAAAYQAAKAGFLKLEADANGEPELTDLAERITREANELGIGPMGFGGKTTLLGTTITSLHRLPASYFVTLSYMCWAFRRRRLVIDGDKVSYV